MPTLKLQRTGVRLPAPPQEQWPPQGGLVLVKGCVEPSDEPSGEEQEGWSTPRTSTRTMAPARGSCSCLAPLPRSETEWGRLGRGWFPTTAPEQSVDKARELNHEPARYAPNRQVIVGHRLVQAHLEATIVVTAGFWHSCCWWAPPTPARFARFLPSHYAAKTPLRRRGIC